MSVSCEALINYATPSKGSSDTTSFISGKVFTSGFRAQPVWKISLGRSFAIAPMNYKPSYAGGLEK